MTNGRKAQAALGALLGMAFYWEAFHGKSVVWLIILGVLAVVNILSAFVIVSREEDDHG